MAFESDAIINQFTIPSIAAYPCEANYLALLNLRVTLKRPYDANEGVKNTNEYGEVIMTYPDAPIILEDLPIRIDPIKQRGETGFKVKTQGGEVFATALGFVCGNVDIKENDTVYTGTREYLVLLVDELYDADSLHHKEVLLRRVDNL